MARDWEKYDKARLELAVDELAKSVNLRFFLRQYLYSLGATGTPDGTTDIEMARAIGRHGAGTDLIGLLEQMQPGLYSVLLSEDALEQHERTKDE